MARAKLLFPMLVSLFIVNPAYADALGLRLSVQQWQDDSSGYFGEASDATISPAWSKDTVNRFEMALEHPLPLVPNLQVSYSQAELSGSVKLLQTYRLGSQLYSVANTLDSKASYSKTDFTLYYELLDSSLIEIDLGVQLRYLSADFNVADKANQLSSSRQVSEWQPRGYLKLQSGLPLVGIQSYVQLAMDQDSEDLEAAIGYRILEGVLLDTSIFIGYRDSRLEMSDVEGIFAKNESQGVFVSLEAAF